MNKSKLSALLPASALLLMLYTLAFPLQCSFHVTKALDVCLKNLIPSLFPFMLLVKLYCYTKPASPPNIVSKAFSSLLGISPYLFDVVMLGLFCGFPTGAMGTISIYKRGLCTKYEAEKAVALSNNCSAAFLINVVGTKMLKIPYAGYVLLLSQCIAVIICAFLLRYIFPLKSDKKVCFDYRNIKEAQPDSAIMIFSKSIKESINAVLNVSAYVMFFSLFTGIISDKLQAFTQNNTLITLISGIFEVSGAIQGTQLLSFPRNIIVSSFVCSLSGLSVFFQVAEICVGNGIKTKMFLISHILCSLISPIICSILLYFIPEFEAMSFTHFSVICDFLKAVSILILVYISVKVIRNVKVNKISRI